MERILVLGAGRSSGSLIQYLGKWCETENFSLVVADLDYNLVEEKTKGLEYCTKIKIEKDNTLQLEQLVSESTMVVSLLPVFMHYTIAQYCIKHKKNMATASYVSPELKELENQIKENNLCFLFELGVDPGIDHLSAKKLIDEIEKEGGHIHSFKSYTGALLHPNSETANPWKYLFTWNPRNVVLAGQGSWAKFKEKGQIKYLPYSRIFKETTPINLKQIGDFEAYVNRDSLEYEKSFGLENCDTIIRGTLRRPFFSEAWNILVYFGITADNIQIPVKNHTAIKQFYSQICGLEKFSKKEMEQKIGSTMSMEAWRNIEYLELDSPKTLEEGNYTPAQILEQLLIKKWKFEANHQDRVVMCHIINYTQKQQEKQKISYLTIDGNKDQTAISSSVGLPLAMGVKQIVQKKFQKTGIHIPIYKELYEPILAELETFGIKFYEITS